VLVCGGAGYVGSHVVRGLLRGGHTPIVLDDLSTGHREALPAGVELTVAPLTDRAALEAVLAPGRVEAVVHACGAPPAAAPGGADGTYRAALLGSLALLEAMVEHRVSTLVLSSYPPRNGPESERAEGPSGSALEQVVREFAQAHGLRWVALRYVAAAGAAADGTLGEDHRPETHLIPLAMRRAGAGGNGAVEVPGEDYPTADGTFVRDYLHVADVAEAHVLALEYLRRGGASGPIDLGGGALLSVREVLAACERVTGRRVPARAGPRRADEPAFCAPDGTRAGSALGWRPRQSDADHIIRTAWRWHQGHPCGYGAAVAPPPPVETPRRSVLEVAVFGMGYVGTSCAAFLASRGHRTIGVELDPAKRGLLAQGRTPLREPGLQSCLRDALASGQFRMAETGAEAVRTADVSLLCVGTPSSPEGQVDLSHLRAVAREVGAALAGGRRFHTVLVRSTCPPGTAEELDRIVAEASGRTSEEDFAVVSNPEFLREGSALRDMAEPPFTIVGSANERALEVVRILYESIRAPMIVLDRRTAEQLKYACNAFHALKVAFANEINELCRIRGVDGVRLMEVFCRDAQLNISRRYLRPGFAFGGACLPKDLRALIGAAGGAGVRLPVLEGALASNRLLIERTAGRILQLDSQGSVGLLGLAFKEGSDDLRESPYVQLARKLRDAGRTVLAYDPAVDVHQLFGASLQFVREALPELPDLVCDDPGELARRCRIVVVSRRDPRFVEALRRLRSDQFVYDLAGLPIEDRGPGRYVGLSG